MMNWEVFSDAERECCQLLPTLPGANNKKVLWLSEQAKLQEGRVDEAVFLAFDDNDYLIGISDIRLGTNDFIQTFAGQIGYSVRPSQRRKGYASEILKLTLIEATKCGLSKILITCNEPNIASAKVIEKNGGVLEKIIPHPGFPNVKRYRINIR